MLFRSEFNIQLIPLPANVEGRFDIRLTLDTQDDFELLRKLYRQWYKSTSRTLDDLLSLVDKNQEYSQRMKENMIKNEK